SVGDSRPDCTCGPPAILELPTAALRQRASAPVLDCIVLQRCSAAGGGGAGPRSIHAPFGGTSLAQPVNPHGDALERHDEGRSEMGMAPNAPCGRTRHG